MKQERELGRERSGGELAMTVAMEAATPARSRMAKFALTIACMVQWLS